MKEADGAKIQFDDFLKSVVLQIFQVLRFFDLRLDQFLSPHLTEILVRCRFLLSHGQSAVERGFNINKHLLVENLREVSTRDQRLVCDYFQPLDVKLHKYTIPKEFQVHSIYEEIRRKTKDLIH